MSWVSTQREDELVDLWPEHAEQLIGAMEFHEADCKAIVMYLDLKPLGLSVNMVSYMSWKPPFSGVMWLDEVFRRDNLIWTSEGFAQNLQKLKEHYPSAIARS